MPVVSAMLQQGGGGVTSAVQTTLLFPSSGHQLDFLHLFSLFYLPVLATRASVYTVLVPVTHSGHITTVTHSNHLSPDHQSLLSGIFRSHCSETISAVGLSCNHILL